MSSELQKRKVCVVTGTRAEYGLLRWLMQGISSSEELELQVIATGMHLSPEFGLTYREIEKDGFNINKKVEMLLSADTSSSISKSIGLGIIGFSDAFEELNPDIVVLLGDRFEILAASVAAMVKRVPIAHIHGGEATEGLIDESIRHSITKMSHLHFVAAEEYRNRVIQLGEQPERVFQVGGMGIDAIRKLKLLGKSELERELEFQFLKKNLLVTFHPVTLEKSTSVSQFKELVDALSKLDNTGILFTMPNADTEGRAIFDLIHKFCSTNKSAKSFISLGQLKYLSCLQFVDCVVGNSSSGFIEVPSFNKATVNIGDRQRGRLRASSVIDSIPVEKEILHAIEKVYSVEFQKTLKNTKNPYGEGGASEKILKVLTIFPLAGILKKKFFDLKKS